MVLAVFKIALRLSDWYVFMRQSLQVLKVFITVAQAQVFWKTKFFRKILEYGFLVESTTIKHGTPPYKIVLLKPMLRQSEWGVQNRLIGNNGDLPRSTSFF